MVRCATCAVLCLTCAMSLPALFGADQAATPEQVMQEARLRVNERRAEEDAITVVKRLCAEYLDKARTTRETLEKMQTDTQDLANQINTLQTSDEGKRIASDPVLLVRMFNVQKRPVTTPTDLTGRLKTASSNIQRMEPFNKPPATGALPSKQLRDDIDAHLYWAGDAAARLSAQRKELQLICLQAPDKVDLAKAKPLGRVLDEYEAKWPILLAESDILGTEKAYGQSKQMLVDAVIAAQLARALAEIERLKTENQMVIKQIQADAEISRLQKEQELQRNLNEAQIAHDAEITRLKLELQMAKVQLEKTVVVEETKIQAAQNETERLRLLKEIKTLEVDQLLGCLFEPGYWQPGSPQGSAQRQPMSLTALGSFGALTNTTAGHSRLLAVLTTPADKVRTRWPVSQRLDSITPEQRDALIRAQALLNRLGKTMVEQGLLSK